jgi:hypothetical protein
MRYDKLNILKLGFEPLQRKTSSLLDNQHDIHVLKYDTDLMDTAYRLLTENKYFVEKIDEDNYLENSWVEDHLYVHTQPGIFKSRFCNHIDNKSVLNYDVHTCIFYLENTFEVGGNLRIMSSIRVDSECLEEIDIRKWNVVLLDGCTPHEIGAMYGVGKRRCIVVQIRQSVIL